MKKEKYDLVFGLGMACSCSQTLRRAELQHLSFPGDWTAPVWGEPPPEHDLRARVEMMRDDLEGLLEERELVFHGPHEWNGKDIYINHRNGYVFNHDFPHGVPLHDSLPKIQAKYARRQARLYELIRQSKKVLVVRIDRPDCKHPTPLDDCRYARETLAKKFPGVRFDFLLMQMDAGRAFAERTVETLEPGFTRVAFDYWDKSPGVQSYQPKFEETVAAVSALCEVRDYRTAAEKRAYWLARARQRWAKYGATTFLGYVWRRCLAVFKSRNGS